MLILHGQCNTVTVLKYSPGVIDLFIWQAVHWLQDISHHRRFAPLDVSHPSSRRFALVAVTACPSLRRFALLWDVSHPRKTFRPLCETFCPLCETFRPLLRRFAPYWDASPPGEDVSPPENDVSPLSKRRHSEPLCETFRPHFYRTFRTLGKLFRPRYYRTFPTLEDVSPPFL